VAESSSDRVVLEGLSPAALRAIAEAEDEARDVGHGRLGTEHLLLGVLAIGGSVGASALEAAGVHPAAAHRKVAEAVSARVMDPRADNQLVWSARAERALGRAFRFSKDQRAAAVGTSHLLLGVLDVEGTAGQVLRGLGVDLDAVRSTLTRRAGETDADVTTSAPAASRPSTAVRAGAPAGAPAPSCPACGGAVAGSLVHQVLSSRGARGDRDVVVFSCGSCGAVLGVAPPPPRTT
jgi:ATP-dependent Clp protease ATP-binding subunit ClpC